MSKKTFLRKIDRETTPRLAGVCVNAMYLIRFGILFIIFKIFMLN
ncbi:hypothetical protein EDWATA_02699 [Edwardsiella tarda ATCC 23685]|uniref:Uncharacterized protein n=1 Tax=Edwardsiella tarda ATCC 23685 TaxID=500638 RepID=D4F7G4_EDWTA|nr:hypothetical protein EDWATA_02699 [Edwardsiella tarda ATCC 23685]